MSTAAALLLSMRPRQWTKSLIVFTPAIFAAELLVPVHAARVTAAFVLLCLVSGCGYIFNDLCDMEADRVHPEKRLRPLAAGLLAPRVAGVFAVTVSVGALLGAYALRPALAVILLAYLSLQIAYTLWLKRVPVIELLSITAGFVLRAMAGAAVIGVPDSRWLLACAASLVLFLALAKRRGELVTLSDQAVRHRDVLAAYTVRGIDVALAVVTAVTVAGYTLFTLLVSPAAGHPSMWLTIPFVAGGLGRYLYLIYADGSRRSSEDLLLTDAPLISAVMLWLAAVTWIIYFT